MVLLLLLPGTGGVGFLGFKRMCLFLWVWDVVGISGFVLVVLGIWVFVAVAVVVLDVGIPLCLQNLLLHQRQAAFKKSWETLIFLIKTLIIDLFVFFFSDIRG